MTESVARAIEGLTEMRDLVTRAPDGEVTMEQVREYLSLADSLRMTGVPRPKPEINDS